MEDYKKTHEWWEDWPTTNGTRLPQTGITTLESWDNIMDFQRKIIQKTDLSFASGLAYTYGACLCSSLPMLPSFKERLSSPKGAKRMRFGLGCPFYHFSILLAAVSIPSCLSIFWGLVYLSTRFSVFFSGVVSMVVALCPYSLVTNNLFARFLLWVSTTTNWKVWT
jgi:hypothetical protein